MSDTIESTNKTNVTNRSNWIHFLFSGAILLGSMAFYESTLAERLRREVSQLRRDNFILRTNILKSDRALRQSLAALHEELDQFHGELAIARAETGESLAMATDAAVRHADSLVNRLENKRRQEETEQRQLSAKLSKVEQSAAETSMLLNGVSRDVGSVKNEVESVRSVARQATANLQQTNGKIGMISGMIATNSDEIQMLRDLGDRNVYEFTLTKSDGVKRIGDIRLALDKADAKRNVFSVQILAADQRVEKRDKNINEPVQFYVPGKGTQLYELVVNEVNKNTVKGYLATPKV